MEEEIARCAHVTVDQQKALTALELIERKQKAVKKSVKERMMDKEFWANLAGNKYEIPDGHTLKELTEEIFSYIGSTDPELRDDIGYIVYANWLKMGLYSQVDIENHITELLANLEKGIGEKETDSVFLRTFSVLFLAEIVHNDNKVPALDKSIIDEILPS